MRGLFPFHAGSPLSLRPPPHPVFLSRSFPSLYAKEIWG
ncbi:hypothetical protein MUK42_02675 [Musa troglodytarum]|uniref:Uncharacterized protein n=1 Tax=Musa troglodytarum TaxID=320322 RepID=A0A9E7K3S9_9LILI|nr:hypothetical protein MUK42_02675 [Musa troglodytarum]